MIETSPTILAISTALFKFQGAVDGVGKDSKNPAFKSKYASLEAVHDTAVPELQKVGVFYLQSPGAIVEGNMEMTTRLVHAESGEWIQGRGDIPLGKRDPQGAGSAQTYAQRYHLMAMLGLPPIDDDGEAAIDRNNTRATPTGLKEQLVASIELEEAKKEGNPRTKWGVTVEAQREIFAACRDELDACHTLEDLGILWASPAFKADFKHLQPDWQRQITEHKDARKADLTAPAKNLGEHLDRLERAQQ